MIGIVNLFPRNPEILNKLSPNLIHPRLIIDKSKDRRDIAHREFCHLGA